MDIQEEKEAFEKKFPVPAHWIDFCGLTCKYICKYNAIDDQTLKYQARWESWLAAKAKAVPEWISVEDKLPAIGVYVMVFLEKQGHNPTNYNFCQYTKFGFHLSNVTYWMPLPKPPKAQEQKG